MYIKTEVGCVYINTADAYIYVSPISGQVLGMQQDFKITHTQSGLSSQRTNHPSKWQKEQIGKLTQERECKRKMLRSDVVHWKLYSGLRTRPWILHTLSLREFGHAHGWMVAQCRRLLPAHGSGPDLLPTLQMCRSNCQLDIFPWIFHRHLV